MATARCTHALLATLLTAALLAHSGCSETQHDNARTDASDDPRKDAQVWPLSLAAELMRLEADASGVHVIGAARAVTPIASEIEVISVLTGSVVRGVCAADGSFDVVINASAQDTFSVRALDGTLSSNIVRLDGKGARRDDSRTYSCQDLQREVLDYLTVAAKYAGQSCTEDDDCDLSSTMSACTSSCIRVPIRRDKIDEMYRAVGDVGRTICPKLTGCPMPREACEELDEKSYCLGGVCRNRLDTKPADVSDCEWTSYEALRAMQRAAETVDLGCESDTDCIFVPADSACNDACAVSLISKAGVAQLDVERKSIEQSVCGAFANKGCQKRALTCGPVRGMYPACFNGRCFLSVDL